jgi:hypothetical protein
MSDDEKYRDLADRLLQMEVELERARELLRAADVQVWPAGHGDREAVEVAVDSDQIARIISALPVMRREMADPESRQSLSVKFECVVLLLGAFAKVLKINYVAALKDIEREIWELLLGMAAAKESKQ